ncbi:MAG: hydrogenase 4 subunit B [Xanthobacteraceae bacterium]|nr:hydrogenase 4 subunit B [Xanthobacteraceae bacterium]
MPAVAGLACVAALFAIGLVAIAIGRSRAGTTVVYGASLLVSSAALLFALADLILANAPASITLPLGLPWIGAHFRIDALAAFFLIIVNLGGAIASIYALGYGAHEASPLRVLPFYPAFLGAMNLVVLADDAFVFLLSWEFMSLVSWGMVVAHHRVAANVRAGYIYLVMASFGTLCLFLAFGVLAGTGGQYSFAAMRAGQLTPALALIAGTLTLIGAGSKAGIVPLHVWLPLAHPAAPSHVSALLSGVMTKVGVYGFIRVVFDLIGEPTPYAGLIVAAIGGITAALGVLYALMQHDLKRLLAYHTVENIGIIFIGLGLALAFRANGIEWAAALALAAALFHVFNHSVFKSLLFFGAGSVLMATGERDMEHLGGLIHRMPHTAFAFLIGCMAISALPPLNGFVSEWLTFQAILVSPQLPQWGLKLVIPAVGALLALSAALAAACFVKAFGVTFLGRARSNAAQAAHEVDQFQRVAMFVLVTLCILAGIFPGFVIDALAPVTRALVGGTMPQQAFLPWLSVVPIVASRSSYNGLLILLFLVGSATLTAAIIHRFATRATRRSPIWDCGFPLASPVAQYTSSSFAMPIRRVFGASVFRVREQLDMPPPGAMRAGHFQVRVFDPAWFAIYGPIARSVRSTGIFLNRVQFLTIRSYLTLVFGALVVLLLVVAAWR